jgi:hypothetical protein
MSDGEAPPTPSPEKEAAEPAAAGKVPEKEQLKLSFAKHWNSLFKSSGSKAAAAPGAAEQPTKAGKFFQSLRPKATAPPPPPLRQPDVLARLQRFHGTDADRHWLPLTLAVSRMRVDTRRPAKHAALANLISDFFAKYDPGRPIDDAIVQRLHEAGVPATFVVDQLQSRFGMGSPPPSPARTRGTAPSASASGSDVSAEQREVWVAMMGSLLPPVTFEPMSWNSNNNSPGAARLRAAQPPPDATAQHFMYGGCAAVLDHKLRTVRLHEQALCDGHGDDAAADNGAATHLLQGDTARQLDSEMVREMVAAGIGAADLDSSLSSSLDGRSLCSPVPWGDDDE